MSNLPQFNAAALGLANADQGALADTAVQPGDLPDFGDIVSHDAAEFASAAQGALADSALQSVPIATDTTLGGIKSSADIIVDVDGIATVNGTIEGGRIVVSDIGSDDNILVTITQGFAINLNRDGGTITTGRGGLIQTTGLGGINFGDDGTRTVITGTATANRAVSFPDASGTLALISDIPSLSGYQTTAGTLALAGFSSITGTISGSNVSGGTLGATAGTNLTGTAASLTAGLVTSIGNLAGDVTSSNRTTTLATVNSNVGSFGSATQSAVQTVNAKGLTTSISNVTITPAVGSITGLGTGVATWLATPTTLPAGTTASSLTSFGSSIALGTPASGTLTNCTGTASGLTAGTATALATARTFNGASFDGTANVTLFYRNQLTSTVVVTNSTTYVNNCAITLPVGTYRIKRSTIILNSSTTGLSKDRMNFTGTATATAPLSQRAFATATDAAGLATVLFSQSSTSHTYTYEDVNFGSNRSMMIEMEFELTVTVSGVLSTQHAMSVASGGGDTATAVIGSYLEAMRLS